MQNFRTDMAIERRDIYKKANNIAGEIEGLESSHYEPSKTIKVEKVAIINENGAKAIGKPVGDYITIDVDRLRNITEDEEISIANVIRDNLKALIGKHIDKTSSVLIVGLGNLNSTPDSLGPKVAGEIDVTRHIFKYMPQYISSEDREVSAIAPGVLGTTGIETQEILKGIVENIKPSLIIVIDSLSSKSIKRISSSIQLSDTGIIPGAGVGNNRKEISENTLGVPVIAIGIPTVVDLSTIVFEGLDIFMSDLETSKAFKSQNEDERYEEIKKALSIGDYNMIVTPKEIDELVENMKNILAKGINYAIN